jgi:hypothetical protein
LEELDISDSVLVVGEVSILKVLMELTNQAQFNVSCLSSNSDKLLIGTDSEAAYTTLDVVQVQW